MSSLHAAYPARSETRTVSGNGARLAFHRERRLHPKRVSRQFRLLCDVSVISGYCTNVQHFRAHAARHFPDFFRIGRRQDSRPTVAMETVR